MNKLSIIVVAGKLCSGKTTLVQAIKAHYEEYYDKVMSVEISSLVRAKLMQDNDTNIDRKALQDSSALERYLKDELHQLATTQQQVAIRYNSSILMLVVGPRQVEPIKDLPNCTYIWIETPLSERQLRYRMDSKKNSDDFFAALQRDDDLGLKDVCQFIQQKMNKV